MITERLKAWFKDEGSVGDYRQAVYLLDRSGVFDILRRIGVPTVFDRGESQSVMAGQAHYAAGYQAALDQLQYFEQTFQLQALNHVLSDPDFGAEEEALRKGHLRPEDLK